MKGLVQVLNESLITESFAKVSIAKTLTTPKAFIKSDKDTVLDGIYSVVKTLNVAIDKLTKCEYDHGRNSKDSTHANEMRTEKRLIISLLNSVVNAYVDLNDNIDDKKDVTGKVEKITNLPSKLSIPLLGLNGDNPKKIKDIIGDVVDEIEKAEKILYDKTGFGHTANVDGFAVRAKQISTERESNINLLAEINKILMGLYDSIK